jgi:hypothetical protein
MDAASWGVLSTYESAHILARLYRHVHRDAELSPSRASEIAAWFSQGREYFSAAETSGPLVRPVLQYYGALGLARGTILFLSKGNNHGLTESHGVLAGGWKEHLKNPLNRTSIDLKVTLGGSFISLAKVTQNKSTFSYHKQFSRNPSHEAALSLRDVPGALFGFGDTLARMSDLGPIYQRCTSDQSAALPASVSVGDLNGIVLSIVSHDLTEPEDLIRRFGLSDQWSSLGKMFSGHSFLLNEASAFDDHVPHIETCSDGSSAIVAAYANGIHLSRLLRTHLLAAFLGTYARYHPEPWMEVVFGHAEGDHMMPLIRSATDLVNAEYPRLIVSELEGRL